MNTIQIESYTILKSEEAIFITILFNKNFAKSFDWNIKDSKLYVSCYNNKNEQFLLDFGLVNKKTELSINLNSNNIFLNQISKSGKLLITKKI